MDGGTNQYLIIAIFHLICLIMTNTRIIIAWQFDSIMFLSETSHAIMLRFSWGWKRCKKILKYCFYGMYLNNFYEIAIGYINNYINYNVKVL